MTIDEYAYNDGDIVFRTVTKAGMGKPKPQLQCRTATTGWTPLKNAFQRNDETNEKNILAALGELNSCDDAFELLAKRVGR